MMNIELTGLIAAVPVPRDLNLPLPLEPWLLELLLVGLFLLHILFVNLMVGGSLLTVAFEIIGLNRPKYDALARRIGETITVNKSLAVVLGVGPMLVINLLYTTHFYSANALTGYAWIAIVPLVITAFLITYLHKYTWERWSGDAKRYHILLGAFGSFLFLTIPLIFLANINLMLFPDHWHEVEGFFSSLSIGNVFPRYFHFLTASLAVTGLFASWWFSRRKYPLDEKLPEFTRPQLRRLFYQFLFFITLAQIAFGPLLLLTLPGRGLTLNLLLVIGTGLIFAALLLTLVWREIRSDDRTIGRYFPLVAVTLTVLVVFMGTGRHMYREASIAPHRDLITDRTANFQSVELATMMRIDAGLGAGDALASGPTGKSVFLNCAACHAVDRVLAAPSLREVYAIYKDNPAGIISWAKKPGKKRPEFAPMPSMGHLGDEKLQMVADYMLQLGGPDSDGDRQGEEDQS